MKRAMVLGVVAAVLGAAVTMIAVPAAAQDGEYDSEEVAAAWASDGTVQFLQTDQAKLLGLRDDDYCQFAAKLLLGINKPTDEQLTHCGNALATFTSQAWVPETMLRAFSPPPSGDIHTIIGIFTLVDKSAKWPKGRACRGKGGYSDIRAGMQVTVRDADGKLLGAGEFDPGDRQSSKECWFFFRITGLPEVPLYEVAAGRRGSLVYSLQDLEDSNWTITPGIG